MWKFSFSAALLVAIHSALIDSISVSASEKITIDQTNVATSRLSAPYMIPADNQFLPYAEMWPRVLGASEDGRRLFQLFSEAAIQDPALGASIEDLFVELARVREQLLNKPEEVDSAGGDKEAALKEAIADADKSHAALKDQLDEDLSTTEAKFQSVAFGCLNDRRKCSEFGFGYLDCELTMIMCFLEVVLD